MMLSHLLRNICAKATASLAGYPDPRMALTIRTADDLWGKWTAWSIHPRALAALPPLTDSADLLIVECGSGYSSVVLHHWAARRGAATRIVSYEHQGDYAAYVRNILGGQAGSSIIESPLRQVTEYRFREMLRSPKDAQVVWDAHADQLPCDLYGHTRTARAFYDELVMHPPVPLDDEDLVVVLDGPNGSGRSIAFPTIAGVCPRPSLWLIDDWDHYPFLDEMRQVYDILAEHGDGAGEKRWKLVQAVPKTG